MAILGGLGTVLGPARRGLVMTQISEVLWARFPEIYLMIFGGLLVALLIALPRGIVPANCGPVRAKAGRMSELLLAVENVSVAFGGVQALSDVSLEVRAVRSSR